MSPTSPRVRVSWSPAAAPLQVEELAFGGQVLLCGAERRGGEVELPLPETARAPQLRWQLAEGDGREPIDEIRVEFRDGAGRWHLLGELLGGGGLWRGERLCAALRAPTPLCDDRALACAL